jgi:hypothetical protein
VPAGKLDLLIISAGIFADDFAPESLGGKVLLDLTDHPAAGEAVENPLGNLLAGFLAAVFAHYEEFGDGMGW